MKQRVFIFCDEKRFARTARRIKKAAEQLLDLSKEKKSALEIYIVGDKFMKKNVLAMRNPRGFPRPDIVGKFLGEIYLNPDYIKAKGEDIFFMTIHGFLHLLGYDHEKKSDRIRMEKKEVKLLKLIEIRK